MKRSSVIPGIDPTSVVASTNPSPHPSPHPSSISAPLPKPMNEDEIRKLIDDAKGEIKAMVRESIDVDGSARANSIDKLNRDRIEAVQLKVAAIDKTATNARVTAESLRQSVIDQQVMVNRASQAVGSLIEAKTLSRTAIGKLNAEATLTSKALEALSTRVRDVDAGSAERLDTAEKRLRHLKKTIKRLEMSYVEEAIKVETATAAPGTAPNPTIVEALKALGGVAGTAATIGLTAEFVREGSNLVLSRAHAMGMISKEQAESDMIKAFVATALPAILFVCAQYDWCPKREVVAKIASIAVSGQVAEKSAELTRFGMLLGKDLLALPSAVGIEEQLSAAQ